MSMCDERTGAEGGVLGGGDLSDLAEAIDRYAACSRAGRPAQEHRDEMVRFRHLIDRMELIFSTLTAELAGYGETEWEGQRSPAEWVRKECKTWSPVANNALSVGIEAVRLPQATQALLAGEIGFAHLALLARTALELPAAAPGGVDEASLLEMARQHSVGRFREDCDHYRHASDPRRFLEDQVANVEARSLELRTYQNGCLGLHGFLDAEGGATLRTALEPLARVTGAGDGRGRDRRLADALVELCGHALDAGTLPQHAGRRPHLQLTCSLETLQDQPGAPAGRLELGRLVAAETVRRLACDAGVTRVVFDASSAVVDVGRTRRVPGASTRRALAARDGGCVWPGCERPVGWTHAHHLTHWARGGKTDVDNLVLICRYHHWKVHEGGWDLCRDGDRVVPIPPVPRTPVTSPARAPTA
jgi:hypothetical protein